MEKVLDKNAINILVIFILLVSCKQPKNVDNLRDISHKAPIERCAIFVDCLNEEDVKKIDQFKQELELSIINRDTVDILNHVKLPFYHEGVTVDKDQFLRVEIEFLMSYFSKKVMTTEEASEVIIEEKFINKKKSDCKRLFINNSFPESEFNFIMYFDEIKGKIKLTKFIFAG